MRPARLLLLVHGRTDSIEAVRARELSRHWPADRIETLYRGGSRAACRREWQAAVAARRPDLVYVLNTALPGAVLAPWWRTRHGLPYVLDTGDVIYEMARRSGIGGGPRLPWLWLFERLAQNRSAALVVRGTRHQEHLRQQGHRRVEVIRDGYVEPAAVDPGRVDALRSRLGLEGRFVLGVMGSTVFSPRLGICYGWDLVEALAALPDLPVHGLVIGDGTGLGWLKEKAVRLGVADRVVFTGRIPYPEVPVHLRLMDVALSTQTNNLPGQVRTTGKLPEYMAAGRFILASKVGEAALLLPPEMLLEYQGEVDPAYPARVAGRIRELVGHPERMARRESLPGLARRECGYEGLSLRWARLMEDLTGTTAHGP